MTARAPTKDETWEDWLPYATWGIQRDQLVKEIVDQYGVALDAEQIQSWEREGIIPPPIDGDTYPLEAEMLFRAALHHGIENHPAQIIRDHLRGLAAVLSQNMKLETHERLTELRASELQRRQTWRNWFPNNEPTLTVDDLLSELQAIGVDVDQSTLRFWQKDHILPIPERRKIGTGTYAVYPPVAVALIKDIRDMQARGLKLKVIRPRIRGMAITMQHPDPLGLSRPVTAAARKHEERAGERVEHAVVTFTNHEGVETSYVVSILDE